VPVDVLTQIEIHRPRADVAAFATDPDNATAWYENIKAVVWQSARPLAVGTKLEFVAQFLGRRLAYTYEVAELVPGDRFMMRTAQGPFPMETTYTWEDADDGATRMTLRNRGEPTGFAKLSAPMVAAAMRRANRKDLDRLRVILERSGT
jgi:ligand-binding SRPBCC domain-containing protein